MSEESNVIELPVVTTLDLDPDRVLQNTIGKMSNVIIIGEDKDGEFHFASSKADGGHVIWYLELAKKKLLETLD